MTTKIPEKTARQAMMAGSFWTISMRWSMKLLGFVSTAILARLLLPSDYAVVAMAYLIVGLTESFFDFGVEAALIRKGTVEVDFINSAWSLRVVEGVGVASLLILLSPLAGYYFHDQRVIPVLGILAICLAMGGTSNIGLMLARKNLNFGLEFKIQVISKIFQVLATTTAAYYLRDYRALVIGIVLGSTISWSLGYVMHPYRPRWNTACFHEIWQVTRWLMASNIARFLVRKADEISAGRLGTSSQFGMYNVGADLGQLPTGEVGPAILKAFFPVLSSLQHEPDRVRSGVLKVLAILNAITLPSGIGLAAVAYPVTILFLGPNWAGAFKFVAIFGLIGAAQVAFNPLVTLLLMKGFTKIQSFIVWIEFVVFVFASFVFVPIFHLEGLAFARLAGVLVAAFLICYYSAKKCDLPMVASASLLLRPLISSIGMYIVAAFIVKHIANLIFGLIAAIIGGGMIYILLMLISWKIFDKPNGLETEIIKYLRKR